jgi:hypothetical protein
MIGSKTASGLLCGLVALAALAGTAQADLLWDNGDTDGSNGFSNLPSVFSDGTPASTWRHVLDDFVVPAGETWAISDLHFYHIWNSTSPGFGTGLEMAIRQDNANTPGAIIVPSINQTSYTEVPTGRTWFGLDEAGSSVEFDPILLGPGRYWFEAAVIKPAQPTSVSFWMVRTGVTGNPAWVNYTDFNGLEPASNLFGSDFDLNFQLTGTVIPEPASALLLALAALPLLRRRA